jgi:hypothetical protein
MVSTSDSGSAKVKLAFQEILPFTEFLLMQLLPLPSNQWNFKNARSGYCGARSRAPCIFASVS